MRHNTYTLILLPILVLIVVSCSNQGIKTKENLTETSVEEEISGKGTENKPEEEIIGFWHDAPVVSSGLGETYAFYENKIYMYRKAEGDCLNRVLAVKGKWKIKDSMLELNPLEETFLEGGKILPSVLACDSVIEGGQTFKREVKAKIINLRMSEIEYLEDFDKYLVEFDGSKYYQLAKDPNYLED